MSALTTPRRKVATSLRRIPVITLSYSHGMLTAVASNGFHQQPVHHLAAGLPGLPPGKAPGHPPQQVCQQRGPGIIGSDCRVLVVPRNPS
jgi:hypothetical protein